MDCSICFGQPATSDLVTCPEDHTFCQSCLNQYVNTYLSDNNTTLDIHGDGTINCLSMGGNCNGKIELKDILARLDDKLKVQLLEKYILLFSNKKQDTSKQLQLSDRHNEKVLELLNLQCPDCGFLFDAFDGCLTVQCHPTYGCGHYFCGLCFKSTNGKTKKHEKMANQHSVDNHKSNFVRLERLQLHYQQYRSHKICRYLEQNGIKGRHRIILLEDLSPHLHEAIGDQYYKELVDGDSIPPVSQDLYISPVTQFESNSAKPNPISSSSLDLQPESISLSLPVRVQDKKFVLSGTDGAKNSMKGFPIPVTQTSNLPQSQSQIQIQTRNDVTMSQKADSKTTEIEIVVGEVDDLIGNLNSLVELENKLDVELDDATKNELYTLDLYLDYLNTVSPALITKIKSCIANHLYKWLIDGHSGNLMSQLQRYLISQLTPDLLHRYSRSSLNYDYILYNILQTQDRQTIDNILQPILTTELIN